MALSSLDDRSQVPDEDALSRVLGRAWEHWESLLAGVQSSDDRWSGEWNFGGPKYGWSLRLKQGRRTIVYLIPGTGRFLVGFVLGEMAVRSALEAGLSPAVVDLIQGAPKYAEGRGFRLEVKSRSGVEQAKKLAAIKAAS